MSKKISGSFVTHVIFYVLSVLLRLLRTNATRWKNTQKKSPTVLKVTTSRRGRQRYSRYINVYAFASLLQSTHARTWSPIWKKLSFFTSTHNPPPKLRSRWFHDRGIIGTNDGDSGGYRTERWVVALIPVTVARCVDWPANRSMLCFHEAGCGDNA